MANAVLEAVRLALVSGGVTDWDITTGTHHKVRFSHRGRRHTVVCAISASDKRAAYNARALVRRLLRQGVKA